MLLGTAEEVKAQVDDLKCVTAECVSRIVVAADLLPEIIKVLQMTWDKRREQIGEENETSES